MRMDSLYHVGDVAGGNSLALRLPLAVASGETVKADQAEAAVAAGGAHSVQVLSELANVARERCGCPEARRVRF
jgi:hypothetical protein